MKARKLANIRQCLVVGPLEYRAGLLDTATDFAMQISIRLNRKQELSFQGDCIASVAALNHDDSVRRIFRLYKCDARFVAERIDSPGTLDVRYWGAECADVLQVYDFFGNEPLANYLYGVLKFHVPGLRQYNVG